MKKCFLMEIEGYELILPKDSVKFKGDIGLVNAYYNFVYEGHEFNVPLVGAVNRKYETILGLVPRERIKNISVLENCLIFSVYNENDVACTFLFKKENDELNQYLCPFLNFEVINDRLIKAKMINDDEELELLFDVVSNEQISAFYHRIGSFYVDQERGDMVAIATYILPYENERYNQIETLINLNGEVVAPYLDVDQHKVYDQNLNFDDIIHFIADDMKKRGR